MSKMQALEMALISAGDFPQLLGLLLDDIQSEFALDSVHLHWVDPQGEVQALLCGGGLDLDEYRACTSFPANFR